MVKVILKPLDDGVTGDIELPRGKTTLGRGTFLNVSLLLSVAREEDANRCRCCRRRLALSVPTRRSLATTRSSS